MKRSTRIKQLAYPLYILSKSNPFRKKRLRKLFRRYSSSARQGLVADFRQQPLRLFSNMEEDGIILYIMASLQVEKGYFIDIGSNDCINSNCANLALNFGWSGIFIDSEQQLLNIGRRNYQLFCKNAQDRFRFIHSFVTPGNINQLVGKNLAAEEVDFISIDIDGNDYAIYKALDVVRPKCYVVENKIEFGKHDLVLEAGSLGNDAGASITAMVNLATEKGYTLVAANKAGFNTFFLRNDLVSPALPALPLKNILGDPIVSRDFYTEEHMQRLLGKLPHEAV